MSEGRVFKDNPPKGMDRRLIRKVRRHDKIAQWAIVAGGVSTIIAVIGILVLIAKVALPLFVPPAVRHIGSHPLPPLNRDANVLLVGIGDYLKNAFLVTDSGHLVFTGAEDGVPRARLSLRDDMPEGIAVTGAELRGGEWLTVTWADGAISLWRIRFQLESGEGDVRTVHPATERKAHFPWASTAPLPAHSILRDGGEDLGFSRLSLTAGGRLLLHRVVEKEDLLGNKERQEVEAELPMEEDADPATVGEVTLFAVTADGGAAYAATGKGYLLRWDLTDAEDIVMREARQAFADGRAITSLALNAGGGTLLVGDANGGLSGWFPVDDPETEDPEKFLTLIHPLKPHLSPVTAIFPSERTRVAASLDAGGLMHLDYVSTRRNLAVVQPPKPLRLAGMSAAGKGLVGLDDEGTLHTFLVDAPHPEISWGGYFTPQFYEGYQQPAFVWQSSAATDEYEPKLSLIPLIFGTLKGTFYGMLFAAPLAILAAIYTSHLMHPRLRRYIKPGFEIMGSVPTVVIGFLAALWLAPIVKVSLMGFILLLGVMPLAVFLALATYGWASRRLGPRGIPEGYEFLFMVPLVVLSVWGAFELGRAFDGWFFAGGLADWLFQSMGMHFDQRNAIIISFAMGFAVLPIIFTISDDALTNVPRHLTAASLALGASRWQTVWRVILPSALPGVFAAVMVGLGRAIGETMIVLMAAGNTPILDPGPFTGMRTLSANIAVEIPEAPELGTLYRTLFLSAVLLFMATFLLNSIAELVRQRLRKKFGY